MVLAVFSKAELGNGRTGQLDRQVCTGILSFGIVKLIRVWIEWWCWCWLCWRDAYGWIVVIAFCLLVVIAFCLKVVVVIAFW